MNDVLNLMRTLGGDLEYREFGAAAAATAAAGSWPVLQRLQSVSEVPHARAGSAESAPAESVLRSEAEPALATQLRVAAIARSERGGDRLGLSLGQYAAKPAAGMSAPRQDDARHLTLAEVFARLAAAPRPSV